MQRILSILVAVALVLAMTGCSKKQLMPGIFAGVGSALIVGGVAYRVSLPDADNEGTFGRQSEQKAGIAILLFAGAALVLTGIIWSATTPVCDSNVDCWSGDICNKRSSTCVPAPVKEKEAVASEGDVSVLNDPTLQAPSFIPDKYALKLTPGSVTF